VFTKWELRDISGYQAPGKARSVDAHACRLRRKLALASAPDLVANVRGVGYRLSLTPVIARDQYQLPVAATAGNGRAARSAGGGATCCASASPRTGRCW